MINRDDTALVVTPDDGAWSASQGKNDLIGPQQIRLHDDCLLDGVRFHVDDMTSELAVSTCQRAYHRAGAAVVETGGFFPFGGETAFRQVCRYAANHVRITFDLQWRRGSIIKRHLGLGSMFLPGAWHRYFCIPPAGHWSSGVKPAWHPIAEEPPDSGSGMIAHWHRPPLALVLERPDGTRLEVGTGVDVWRWEECLGCGPEMGSYKLLQEEGGIRFVREPLMCCEEYEPTARGYRFKWYLAWTAGQQQVGTADLPTVTDLLVGDDGKVRVPEGVDSPQAWRVDVGALRWPESGLRVPSATDFARGVRSPGVVLAERTCTQTSAHVFRSLAASVPPGELIFSGVSPGACWDSGHVDRRDVGGVAHWDMAALLDIAEWGRRQLGDAWHIHLSPIPELPLPALAGLFQKNGFDGDRSEGNIEA